jgi:hypothetical protein
MDYKIESATRSIYMISTAITLLIYCSLLVSLSQRGIAPLMTMFAIAYTIHGAIIGRLNDYNCAVIVTSAALTDIITHNFFGHG